MAVVALDGDLDQGSDLPSVSHGDGVTFGRNATRGRRCWHCRKQVPEVGFPDHLRLCSGVAMVADICVSPVLAHTLGGRGFQVTTGGMTKELQRSLLRFCDVIHAKYSDAGLGRGCRPTHAGKLFGVGWNVRWQSFFGPSSAVAECSALAAELMISVLSTPAVQQLTDSVPVPGTPGLPQVSFGQGGTNAFVGVSYSPVVLADALAHEPPAEVARVQKPRQLSHCSLTCPACTRGDGEASAKRRKCWDCAGCPAHLDVHDSSLTILALHQPSIVPMSCAARLILGDISLPLKGGLIVVLDGRRVSHGVYAPLANPRLAQWPWKGVAFVAR